MKIKFQVARLEHRSFDATGGETVIVKLVPVDNPVADMHFSVNGEIVWHPQTMEPAPKLGEGAMRVAIRENTLIQGVRTADGQLISLEDVVDVEVSVDAAATSAAAAKKAEGIKAAKLAAAGA